MIMLNDHNFHGSGKNEVEAGSSAVKEEEEQANQENTEELLMLAEGSFAVSCRNLAEEGKNQFEKEIQSRLSKLEVTAVCASIESVYNEIQQEPLNPYGEIAVSDQDFEALCRIVQAEAGGEDEQGKILVAEVILNRVLSAKFASSVYDVIFERSGGSPQFSPTVDGRYFSVTVTPGTKTAVEQALNGEDLSNGALFFSARSKADPYDMAWFDRNLKWLFRHGGHEFYTLP